MLAPLFFFLPSMQKPAASPVAWLPAQKSDGSDNPLPSPVNSF